MIEKKKKGEKSIISTIIKIVLFVLALGLQVFLLYFAYFSSLILSKYFTIGFEVIRLISLITILYNHDKPEYKLAWVVFIAFLPVAGIAIYALWGRTKPNKTMQKARKKSVERSHKFFEEDEIIKEEIKKKDRSVYKQVNYLSNITEYPIYKSEGIEYFPIGEKYFKSLIEDLKKAKKYILIEYFILAKGKLWQDIEDILRDKVNEGVKIKIIVDEWGSMTRRPQEFFSEAKYLGIEIARYNPIKYGINNYINYRNHRKIVVIDGCIAYTGGVNLADEYVNASIRYGHWKDNGIRVIGKPVKSFVISFLKTLEVATKKEVDYNWYIENIDAKQIEEIKNNKGYLMFYSDGPDNRKNPAEMTYIQAISQAVDYVYIFTPYLALGKELMESLLTSARSGVDVRIVTPRKPDKWYMQVLTRSYYQVLLEAGVKIYEYVPGFLHGKTIITDDKTSIVGTINLDFRSLNLNYECAVYTYNTGVEMDIKKDYVETMETSEEIKLHDVKKRNVFTRILEAIVTALSPLL